MRRHLASRRRPILDLDLPEPIPLASTMEVERLLDPRILHHADVVTPDQPVGARPGAA